MENAWTSVRTGVLWIGCALVFFGFVACHSRPDMSHADGSGRRVLVVGSDLGNAPFAWIAGEVEDAAALPKVWYAERANEWVVDANGMLADASADRASLPLRALGRDVEMTEDMAASLGTKLVWQRLPFDALLDAVENGEVDAVVATMGWTADRADRVALSEPYYRTTIEAVVRVGAGEPQTVADLKGRRLSAGLGTTSEFAVRELGLADQMRGSSDKGQTGLTGLLGGDLDALVMDGPDARDLVAANPDKVRLLKMPLAQEDYVIAVNPADVNLLEAINHYLGEQRSSGSLAALDARFGL